MNRFALLVSVISFCFGCISVSAKVGPVTDYSSFEEYVSSSIDSIKKSNKNAPYHSQYRKIKLWAPSVFFPSGDCARNSSGKWDYAALVLHDVGRSPYIMHDIGASLSALCILTYLPVLEGHDSVYDLSESSYRGILSQIHHLMGLLAEEAEGVFILAHGRSGLLALRYAGLQPKMVKKIVAIGLPNDICDSTVARRHKDEDESKKRMLPVVHMGDSSDKYKVVPEKVYMLVDKVSRQVCEGKRISVPTLVVSSYFDNGISMSENLSSLKSFLSPKSQFVLYYGYGDNVDTSDDRVVWVNSYSLDNLVLRQTNDGLPVSPNNDLYGVYGSVQNYYSAQYGREHVYKNCVEGQRCWYGDSWFDVRISPIIRDLTYNPNFTEFVTLISKFLLSR